MFDSSKLYKMLKPDSNPNLITSLPVIIGGTTAVPDVIKGCVIVHFLGAKPITNSKKKLANIINNEISETSIYEIDYQIDIYKQNSKDLKYIEVEREAIKIQNWLKSYEVQEYLQSLKSEIYPNYKNIKTALNVSHNEHKTNRAFFDFTIISVSQISESVDTIEYVVFDETVIYQ